MNFSSCSSPGIIGMFLLSDCSFFVFFVETFPPPPFLSHCITSVTHSQATMINLSTDISQIYISNYASPLISYFITSAAYLSFPLGCHIVTSNSSLILPQTSSALVSLLLSLAPQFSLSKLDSSIMLFMLFSHSESFTKFNGFFC